MKLTEAAVEKLEYDPAGKDTQLHWDDDLPGHAVRVYPSGRKAYVVAYRVGRGQFSKPRRTVIEDTRRITLKEAREKARAILAAGRDGRDYLEEVRAKESQTITVQALCEQFLRERSARLKPATQAMHQSMLRAHVIPFMGRKPVLGVQRADVARLVSNIGTRTPTMANRVRAVVSVLFDWAEELGYRAPGTNPAEGVSRFKEEPRRVMRRLPAEKLQELFRVLERLPAAEGAAFRLLVLVGGRVGEVMDAHWGPDAAGKAPYIDMRRRLLVIPDGKTGAREVPLNRAAMLEFERLVLEMGGVAPKEGRIFPPRNVLEANWRGLRGVVGLGWLQLRDLRHVAVTLAGQSGRGGLLGARDMAGHAEFSTTQVYFETVGPEAREASEGLVDRLEAMGVLPGNSPALAN